MRCTLEGETRIPRARSSRATRTLPHSGRSFASASTAARAARALAVVLRSAAFAVVVLVVVVLVIVVAVSAANEVRFRLDAAAARVVCVLRIRTERARTARERVARERVLSGGAGSRADDTLRRDAVLHPVHERRERIDQARRRSAAAVVGARHEKEARELLRLLEVFPAMHRVIHLGVPVHHVLRRERSAGLRLPDDQLAALVPVRA